ncbi:hypothetical protein TRVA0_027S01596 [Trichomonascus vanleenenianus]|uniref:uncharacterized protein n=1 Tax=Trichomonascus vanleenenianus TaxID=2268995 RepID=UPI003ECA1B29
MPVRSFLKNHRRSHSMGTAETDGLVKRLNPIALLRRTSESGEEVPNGDVVELYKNAGIIYGTRKHEWDSGTVRRTSSPRSVSLPMSPMGPDSKPKWRHSLGDGGIVEEEMMEEEDLPDLRRVSSQGTVDEFRDRDQIVARKTRDRPTTSVEYEHSEIRSAKSGESSKSRKSESVSRKSEIKSQKSDNEHRNSEDEHRNSEDESRKGESERNETGEDIVEGIDDADSNDARSVFSFEEDKQIGRNLSVNYHKPAVSAAVPDSPDPLVDAMLDSFDNSPYYEDSLEEFEQKYASFLEPYEEERYNLNEYNDANENDNDDKNGPGYSDVSPLRVSKIYLHGDSDDERPPGIYDIDDLKDEIDEYKDEIDELTEIDQLKEIGELKIDQLNEIDDIKEDEETPEEASSHVSPSTSMSTRSRPSLSLKIPITTRPQQYDFLDYDYSLDDYESGDYDDHLLDEANAIGLVEDEEDYQFYTVSDAQVSIRSTSSGSSGRRRDLLRRDSSIIRLKDNTITLFSRTSEKEEAYYTLREAQFGIAAELPTIPRKASLTPISERSYEGV